MTVKEMIETLQKIDPDAEIGIVKYYRRSNDEITMTTFNISHIGFDTRILHLDSDVVEAYIAIE